MDMFSKLGDPPQTSQMFFLQQTKRGFSMKRIWAPNLSSLGLTKLIESIHGLGFTGESTGSWSYLCDRGKGFRLQHLV